MAATVHSGSLGRFFEELCRLKHEKLRNVVTEDCSRLNKGKLPKHGGVYTFWWVAGDELLRSKMCNRKLDLKGPGRRRVALEIDDEWLGLSTNLPVPLYVGKSASDISKRVGQHLMLRSKRILPLGGGATKAKSPTTSCQLRAGVEHLFPRQEDSRSLVLDCIGFSYVRLDGDENAANRFYLEDLAIGLMRPPLNVDVER